MADGEARTSETRADHLARDKARAAEMLGSALICAYCGATAATFEARCIAPFADTCPGDDAYGRALAAAQRERTSA